MSFDGIVTRAVVKELNDKLIGGKVNELTSRKIELSCYKFIIEKIITNYY